MAGWLDGLRELVGMDPGDDPTFAQAGGKPYQLEGVTARARPGIIARLQPGYTESPEGQREREGALAAIRPGATFGLADEGSAALRHPLDFARHLIPGGSSGPAYEAARDRERAVASQYAEENPAANVAGGVLGGLMTGRAVPAAIGAARTLSNPLVRNVVEGGVEGAVGSAGAAQGDFGDRAKAAALGVIPGAVAGGLFHGAGKVAQRGLENLPAGTEFRFTGGGSAPTESGVRRAYTAKDLGPKAEARRAEIQQRVQEWAQRPENAVPGEDIGRTRLLGKGEFDEGFARDVADQYGALKDMPRDPRVQASYKAFADEVDEQYRFITDELGIKVEPVDGDPYSNSEEMMRDVLENGRLKVFSGGTEHPLIGREQQIRFRGVHDFFGHALTGNSFGKVGEENAARVHHETFSKDARPAMMTLTRGQNSTVNYGPYGAWNRAHPDKTQYVEQRAALLPDEFTVPEPPRSTRAPVSEEEETLRAARAEAERVANLPIPHEKQRAAAMRSAGTTFAPVEAGDFHAAIKRAADAQKGDVKAGDMLSVYTPEEYAKMKTFLSPDGLTGYALKPDGDLVSVFNQGARGAGADAVRSGIAAGATKLDAFDDFLPGYYRQFGFEPTGTFANWEMGGTPVTYMEYRGGAADGQYPDYERLPLAFDGDREDAFRGITPEMLAGPSPVAQPDFIPATYSGRGDIFSINPPAREPLDRSLFAIGPEGAHGDNVGISFANSPYSFDRGPGRFHGIFDPDAPKIQGTMPTHPDMVLPPAKGRRKPSALAEAVSESKTVQRGMDADADAGRGAGGDEWYETGQIKQDLEERAARGEPVMSFPEMTMMGTASSASNGVMNENAAMSILNRARAAGEDLGQLDPRALNDRFQAETGWDKRVPLMGTHLRGAADGLRRGGAIIPADPWGDAWKIPSYANHRMGGGGGLFDGVEDLPDDATLLGMFDTPALDTHERRRIMQLVEENPRLRRIAKQEGALDFAAANKGVIPIQNVLDYQLLSRIYQRGAQRSGLPTPGAWQAGRWLGGATKTGLQSAPRGTYTDLLSDQIKYTAQQQGLDDSPAGLRRLWGDIAAGRQYLLPYGGKGAVPLK